MIILEGQVIVFDAYSGRTLARNFFGEALVIASRNVAPASSTFSFLHMYVPVAYNRRSLIHVCFLVTSNAAADRTREGSPSPGTMHMIGDARLEQNSSLFALVKLNGTSETRRHSRGPKQSERPVLLHGSSVHGLSACFKSSLQPQGAGPRKNC